jgi:2-aminoadipate transaminase
MDLCTSPLAQRIAAAYLALGRYDVSVQRARAEYGARMHAMTEQIDRQLQGKLSYFKPAGGMFVWATMSTHVDPKRLFQASVDAGVLFVPGGSFFAAQLQASTMRLSYAAPDVAAIREGVDRLARAFQNTSE